MWLAVVAIVSPAGQTDETVRTAWVVFDDGVVVSARPSDAIALAMRTGTVLRCVPAVLDNATIAHRERH